MPMGYALCSTPVNIILFEHSETLKPLSRSDPRAVHIVDILRRRPGDDFYAELCLGRRAAAPRADSSCHRDAETAERAQGPAGSHVARGKRHAFRDLR